MANRWLPALAAFLAAQVVCAGAVPSQEIPAPPAETVPAEPAEGYIVVTAAEAEVIAEPASNAAVLLKGYKGDVFPLRGQLAGWYFVATGPSTAGWIRRDSAARLYYPEFLNPEGLAEAWENSAPVYIPPGAWRYPWGWGAPYGSWLPLWRAPLWWGFPSYRYDRSWHGDRGRRHDYYRRGPYRREPYQREPYPRRPPNRSFR